MLGDRLKELRKGKKITQHALGEALEISASAVGMYEQGRREPDNDTLAAMCRYFNVSSDYFLLDGGRTYAARNSELGDVIEDFRRSLMDQDGLMFNGVPLTDEEIAQVVSAIEVGAMVAVRRLSGRGKESKTQED